MRPASSAALIVALVVLLAACGSASDDGDPGDEAGTDPPADGEPRHGGTLTKAESGETPDGLDPHANENVYTHTAVAPMLSKLIDYETGPDVDIGTLSPDLAESWDVSSDGLTYTFNLRDDVVWHDIEPVSGRAFVADDVVATYERMMDGGASAGLYEHVESVEATDDHTVVFTLEQPHVPFLENMASHYAWILPREAEQGAYDVAEQVIGTGPFMLESWTRDSELVTVRNPDYFVEGKPYLDELRTVVILEQGARAQAVRTGRIDMSFTHDPDEADELVASGLEATRYLRQGMQLAFNEDREPFDDPDVVRALTMAIDIDGMNDSLRGGLAVRSGAVAPLVGDAALPEEEVRDLRPHDPEAARQLLVDAGQEDLSFELLTSPAYGDVVQREAEWIVQDLGDIGVDVTISSVDFGTFLGRWQGGEQDYDMVFASTATFLTADEWLRVIGTDHPRNFTSFSDPVVDDGIALQRGIHDADERREAVHDLQRHMLENAQNPYYAYATPFHIVHNPDVRGLHLVPSYDGRTFADVWIDD